MAPSVSCAIMTPFPSVELCPDVAVSLIPLRYMHSVLEIKIRSLTAPPHIKVFPTFGEICSPKTVHVAVRMSTTDHLIRFRITSGVIPLREPF